MSMDVDEIIFASGKRFREERESLGLTQKELANKILTTGRTIIAYESGGTPPTSSKLILFSWLGADVGYILTGVRSSGDLAPDEQTILMAYRLFGTELRESWLEIARKRLEKDAAVKNKAA